MTSDVGVRPLRPGAPVTRSKTSRGDRGAYHARLRRRYPRDRQVSEPLPPTSASYEPVPRPEVMVSATPRPTLGLGGFERLELLCRCYATIAELAWLPPSRF
jgi:hypothetical protein